MAAVVYALTLAIHNTAWGFYGSVGRAASASFAYLPTFIGAALFLLFGQGLLRRVIAISKARNITSVADFISARYQKGRSIAGFVTIASMIGVLPYIALQLKAVALSFEVLTRSAAHASNGEAPFFEATDLWVAAMAAAFTMLFGVRHIHASERHRGFVLALAFESLVKLAAFVIVALYVVYGMFDGVGDLLTYARKDAAMARLLVVDFAYPGWYSASLVAFLAFLCLPQTFHVAVVENDDPASVRPGVLLYLVYFIVLLAFVTPVALAGLVTFGDGVNPDTFMIALPVEAGAPAIALLAFIGGLSAATGMIIISTVALSTMVCNDVVMPLVLRRPLARESTDIARLLLLVRRVLVFVVILLAFATRRLIDDSVSLMQMGVISFVAVAQFGPAFFGGLLWRRASAAGALAGMSVGFAIWAYALLLPAMARFLPVPGGFLEAGPWGIGWLRPYGLFGFGSLDPVSHASLWSLALNVGAFILVSFLRPASETDRQQALAFTQGSADEASRPNDFRPGKTMADLAVIASRFVGADHVETAFQRYLAARSRGSNRAFDLTAPADGDAVRFTQDLIAGAIGAASARVVMAASFRSRALSRGSAKAMLEDASIALHFNHKLLQAIMENVQQGICAVDAEFRISAWNGKFVTMLELPETFLKVGLPLAEIVELNKARGEYGVEQMRLLFVNRDLTTQTWPYVYERTRPDGTVLEVTFNPMAIGGYVATYADVTERHRVARALQATNEILERRVLERTLALEQAKTAAEDANASKTRFLAAASHDLLQPLSAARLFMSALQENLRGRDQRGDNVSASIGFTDNALAALLSTERLLSELLYISSLDSRSLRPEIRHFDIGELMAGLEVEFTALAAQRGLTLRVVGSRVIVETDPALLRRILQNFLSNAIRYTARGRVLLGARRRGEMVRIEVWDTGVGIAENMRREIFQEFRRLPQDAPDAEKGFGLGLAIVERIARLLDQRVLVESRPGRGSMFAIEVPRSRSVEPALALASPLAPKFQNAERLSILCIDNDASILEGMTALLEQWGHTIAIARGLDEALLRLGGAPPDVALVDYHLDAPSNGLEVLARLREYWGADVRAILITADRGEQVAASAVEARCDVLYKPVKPAALRRYLNSKDILAARREADARER